MVETLYLNKQAAICFLFQNWFKYCPHFTAPLSFVEMSVREGNPCKLCELILNKYANFELYLKTISTKEMTEILKLLVWTT